MEEENERTTAEQSIARESAADSDVSEQSDAVWEAREAEEAKRKREAAHILLGGDYETQEGAESDGEASSGEEGAADAVHASGDRAAGADAAADGLAERGQRLPTASPTQSPRARARRARAARHAEEQAISQAAARALHELDAADARQPPHAVAAARALEAAGRELLTGSDSRLIEMRNVAADTERGGGGDDACDGGGIEGGKARPPLTPRSILKKPSTPRKPARSVSWQDESGMPLTCVAPVPRSWDRKPLVSEMLQRRINNRRQRRERVIAFCCSLMLCAVLLFVSIATVALKLYLSASR